MASPSVSHENLEPTEASLGVEVLKAGAALCSLPPKPERIPLQNVPSNLEIALPASLSSPCCDEAGSAGLIGTAAMLRLTGQGASGSTASEGPSEDIENLSAMHMSGTEDSFSKALSAGEQKTVLEMQGEPSKQGLGRAGRVQSFFIGETVEVAAAEVPKKALQSGARRVNCTSEEETDGEQDGAEAEQEKQPLAWFPRAKKDSFLERKIKKMQESEGPTERLGEAFVKKMSRVEREKAAAAAAAEAALAAKKAALVEVSWCRILEAASIPCDTAVISARAAESRASETASAAAALGVVLSPSVPPRPGSTSAPKSASKGGYRDVIFASTASEADVEREVVAAVRAALRRAELTSADADRIENGPTMMSAPSGGAPEVGHKEGKEIESREGLADVIPPDEKDGSPATPFTPVSSTDFQPAPRVESEEFRSPKSALVQTPGDSPRVKLGEDASARSPARIKTPHSGSRFGGLLMACIRPRGSEIGDDEGEASSENEGEADRVVKDQLARNGVENSILKGPAEENETVNLLTDNGMGAPGEKEEGEKAGDRSPGNFERPSKAANRYSSASAASDSDEEEGHVTPAPRAFSKSKSPAYSTPGKPNTPSRETQPGATESGFGTAASPAEKLIEDGPTREKEECVDGLVEAMMGRLEALSAEQRAALSSVIATRGFGGFLGNSPLTSRLAGAAFPSKASGLGDDFLIKRSRLEIAKAEAEAAAKAATNVPAKTGSSVSTAQVTEPGLDQILVKRLSKLELAKAEAVAASKAEAEKGAVANGAQRHEAGLAEPGLDQVLVKRLSKLEKAKADAAAAAKAETAQGGKGVKAPVELNQNGTGSDFGRDLVKHMSKLERAKAEATAAAELELEAGPRKAGGTRNGTENGTIPEPGLGEVLVKRLSKLEQAKADAVAAAKAVPGGPKKPAKVAVDPNPFSGGLDDMVKKTSRLEMEKEAARKAEEALTPTTVLSGGFGDGGPRPADEQGFGHGFVKKMSRLEREKAAAQEQGSGVSAVARTGRPRQDAAAWEGQGLGAQKKHLSRLEREKLAWKEAEEAAQARR